ncbi:uracil-DNA glycosylase [bacterium]|nr:uracil-DNA glycosylase [bacterium]
MPFFWARVLAARLHPDDWAFWESSVQQALKGEGLCPPPDFVFRALELCPPDAVKAVVLGQDPYHGPGQACGLAFSVQGGQALPPSLRNILKELRRDLPDAFSDPLSGNALGDLTPWARSGVLLINTHWSTAPGRALAHAHWKWERLTDAVLAFLMDDPSPKVFLGWGQPAQARIDRYNPLGHPVLRASHPSPLSAHRGFLGCGHFSEANRLLEARGVSPVVWTL